MKKVFPFRDGLLSGELARLAEVSTDTLRHYEKKGVLARPQRLDNGYRKYPASTIDRVKLIRSALSVGFTLEELARFLKAREHGKFPCHEVRALAQSKLQELETLLSEIAALRDYLRQTLKDWDSRMARANSNGPAMLLESLAQQEIVTPKQTGSPHRMIRKRKVK